MSDAWMPADKPVRLLGFWTAPNSTWPDPTLLVDVLWDEGDRRWVADYLNRGQVARQYMGASRCRLCSRPNGASDLTDGVYLWPSGLSHYVVDHCVRLPVEFIAHIEERSESLEQIQHDGGSWWRLNANRI